jgi:predicted ester cyclase
MRSEDIATALRWHGEVFVADKHGVADEICAPGFRWHNPNVPEQFRSGAAGAKDFARLLRAAYPDYDLPHKYTIAESDRVVTMWDFVGTHEGEFLGVPPTGVRVHITGIDIFRVVDGRITDLWQEFDVFGWFTQLGVIQMVVPETATA